MTDWDGRESDEKHASYTRYTRSRIRLSLCNRRWTRFPLPFHAKMIFGRNIFGHKFQSLKLQSWPHTHIDTRTIGSFLFVYAVAEILVHTWRAFTNLNICENESMSCTSHLSTTHNFNKQRAKSTVVDQFISSAPNWHSQVKATLMNDTKHFRTIQ